MKTHLLFKRLFISCFVLFIGYPHLVSAQGTATTPLDKDPSTVYRLYVYHGKSQRDYENGGSKNQGRSKPYTFICEVKGSVFQNGEDLAIGYHGFESRVQLFSGQVPQIDLDQTSEALRSAGVLKSADGTIISVAHPNMLNTDPNKVWSVNGVQKKFAGLGDDTFAQAGFLLIRVGAVKDSDSELQAKLEAFHIQAGNSFWWLEREHVVTALQQVYMLKEGVDFLVTDRFSNKEFAGTNNPVYQTTYTMGLGMAEGCNPCGENSLLPTGSTGGRLNAGMGSIFSRLDLGNNSTMRLHVQDPVGDLRDPGVLTFTAAPHVFTRTDLNGKIDQYYNGVNFTQIVTSLYEGGISKKFTISVYPANEAFDSQNTDLSHTVSAGENPIGTVTIERLDTEGKQVRIVYQGWGKNEQYEYLWLENVDGVVGRNGWQMTEGFAGGTQRVHRKLERLYSDAEGEKLEVIEAYLKPDNLSTFLSYEEYTYLNFPTSSYTQTNVVDFVNGSPVTTTTEVAGLADWRVIKEVRGLGAEEETMITTYVMTGVNRGDIQSILFPAGNWVRYNYDTQGRLSSEIHSFEANAITTDDQLNRIIQYDYTPVGPDTGSYENAPRTITQTVAGKPVNKTFAIIEPNKVRSIEAATPTSTWDDPANLVTTTYTEYGNVVLTQNPDGLIMTERETYIGDFKVVTKAEGYPASMPVNAQSEVGEGTKTVIRFHREFSYDVSTRIYRVLPGQPDLLVGGSNVLERDERNRTTLEVYIDGTQRVRQYSCCGLERVVDRKGIETVYQYDDLLQRISTTRAGVISGVELDGLGRVTSSWLAPESDPANKINEEHIIYNTIGDVVKTVDPVGRETVITKQYAPGSIIESVTYPGGGTSVMVSYPDGGLIREEGTAVRDMAYDSVYNADGTRKDISWYIDNPDDFRKSTTDYLGRVIDNEMPSPTGTGTVTLRSEYELGTGRIRASIDENNSKTFYTYDALGDENSTVLDLNQNGSIDLATDFISSNRVEYVEFEGMPVRKTETFIYQGENDATPTSVGVNLKSIDGLKSWEISYGNTNKVETVRIPATATEVITETLFDGSKNISTAVNGLLIEEKSQDAQGEQLSLVTFGYDQWNRVVTVTDVATGTSTTVYADDGSIASVTTPDPDPNQSGAGYDAQTTSYLSSGLGGVPYAPDGGRIEIMTLPDSTTMQNTYYVSGELKRREGSQTYPTEYTYDYAGRLKTLVTFQDRNDTNSKATTTWNYTNSGHMIFKSRDNGQGPSYIYSKDGRLLKRTWARGVETNYSYLPVSRELHQVQYSDGTPTITNTYDRLGRLIRVADASGVREYHYDETLQLIDEKYISGVLQDFEVKHSYDGLRRLFSSDLMKDAISAHKVSYAYDEASRLSSVSAHGKTHVYSYLPNRPRTIQSVDHDSVFKENRSTDNLGRLTTVEYKKASDQSVLYSQQYIHDDLNQRVRATLKDGSYWEYEYDDLGQLTKGRKKDSAGLTLPGYDFDFDFDDIGNRKLTKQNGRETNYVTNKVNEYTQVDRAPFAFMMGDVEDPSTSIELNNDLLSLNGNLWFKEFEVTSLITPFSLKAENNGLVSIQNGNLVTPSGISVPEYDQDGNLTKDHLWEYTWNAENRLVSQTHRDDIFSSPFERTKITFIYDSQGRRVQKTVYGWDKVSSDFIQASQVRFIYDGWNLIAEIKGDDSFLRTHAWGLDLSGSTQGIGGIGGLLSTAVDYDLQSPGLELVMPVYDGNGNVVSYLSADQASEVAVYEYSPFGKTIRSTDETGGALPFKFSTKYHDGQSGYYYYGYRYYSPETGRWLNQDPIEESGGENTFGFVGNSPAVNVDYLGMFWFWQSREYKRAKANFYNASEQLALAAVDSGELVETQDCPDLTESSAAGWQATLAFESAYYAMGEHDDAVLDAEYLAQASFPLALGHRPSYARKIAEQSRRQLGIADKKIRRLKTIRNVAVATEIAADGALIVTGVGTGVMVAKKAFVKVGAKGLCKMGLKYLAKAAISNTVTGVFSRVVEDRIPPEYATYLKIGMKALNVANVTRIHLKMKGRTVCFVAGTLIATADGHEVIENIRVGDRVLTDAEEYQESTTEVDPDTWRKLVLEMRKPEQPEDLYEIEILRPVEWIESVGAKVGVYIEIAFSELGKGRALVKSIGPCPDLEQSQGRVVLGTVSHLNPTVHELLLSDGSMLQPTGLHMFYSLDRDRWVHTEDLRVGEALKTRTGSVVVEKLIPLDGWRKVYNFEVEGVHRYLVGSSEVFAHNMCRSTNRNISNVQSTRKRLKDSRPKPKPHRKKEKRRSKSKSHDHELTRQHKNKSGTGNKMKTDHGTQTEHFHDQNHNVPGKDNIHYRGTKNFKPGG